MAERGTEDKVRKVSFGKVALVCALVAAAIFGPVLITLGLSLVLGERVWETSGQDELWGPEESSGGIAIATNTQDDGELHDGWDASVGYTYAEESFEAQGDEILEAYGRSVAVDITVRYPRFEGAGEHTEELNELLRETALEMTQSCYLDPSTEMVSIVTSMAGGGVEPSFVEQVDFAITYNTADFVSVSFSDVYEIGKDTGSFIALRCVNFDLRTGKVYGLDDVLTVDEDLAEAFVDTLAAYTGEDRNGNGLIADSEAWTIACIGREAWVDALLGEGDYAHRVAPTFFVDEEGRVNFGVTWWLNLDEGWTRGWWDTTVEGELLDGVRVESELWELLPTQ